MEHVLSFPTLLLTILAGALALAGAAVGANVQRRRTTKTPANLLFCGPKHSVARIAAMAANVYGGAYTDDAEYAIDILADLRHFCDARSLDFAACDAIARRNYREERDTRTNAAGEYANA